ncbi:MAG: hypothetical protein ACFNTC_08860, partial [Prevotella sp.]
MAASLPQAKLAIYFLPNKGKTINPNLSLEQSAFILPKDNTEHSQQITGRSISNNRVTFSSFHLYELR